MSAGREGIAFSGYGLTAGRAGVAAPYVVALGLAGPASLDLESVARAVAERSGLKVNVTGGTTGTAGATFLAFPEVTSHFDEGDLPAQVLVIPAVDPVDPGVTDGHDRHAPVRAARSAAQFHGP